VWPTDEVSPPQTALAASSLRATWRGLQLNVMGLRLSVDTAWGVGFAFLPLFKASSRLGSMGKDDFSQITSHFWLVRLAAAITIGPLLVPAPFV